MKNFTKKVVAGLVCATAFTAFGATGALAETTTMTYNGKIVTCLLEVDWNLMDPDYGKARTSWDYNNGINLTWVYLIGDVANATDTGWDYAEVNVSESGVWDYNSTHKLLHGDGTTSLVTRTLSDW